MLSAWGSSKGSKVEVEACGVLDLAQVLPFFWLPGRRSHSGPHPCLVCRMFKAVVGLAWGEPSKSLNFFDITVFPILPFHFFSKPDYGQLEYGRLELRTSLLYLCARSYDGSASCSGGLGQYFADRTMLEGLDGAGHFLGGAGHLGQLGLHIGLRRQDCQDTATAEQDRKFKKNTDRRDRTSDHTVKSRALYRLS